MTDEKKTGERVLRIVGESNGGCAWWLLVMFVGFMNCTLAGLGDTVRNGLAEIAKAKSECPACRCECSCATKPAALLQTTRDAGAGGTAETAAQ